ncbi:TlpA disulfide reductase family protein [Ruegeria sp. 2205SS24-7]|uniref:TlpA family protein disulfide reductase n=1 Tax=Ruegeria discodermiae TaxID=3064389 RepID=UPI0027422A38|nr:TlpA disulfide reductase family protein [Ruegeria sp. 2205SS24-7]MDP5217466.1 TlpA disulfide reductase family protein [Ruegeria sp. 2205SS24-7]
MKKLLLALVYTALASGANAAGEDLSTLEPLREGDMKKLVFHLEPKPASSQSFDLADGAGTATLADYQGKYVLLNFWATWCAPCRKEMPMLSALQSEFGGDQFEVLTLATGRNAPAGIKKFFGEIGVDNLPRHQDPKMAVAREMAVLGLPITVIIDPEGNEIARLRGDADWNSDSAKAIIAELIAPGS